MATLYDNDGNEFEIDDDLLNPPAPPAADRAPQTNAEFAAVRRANADVKKAERERDEAKKALAFMKAGVDPESSKVAGYFAKAYDGELTPEAIRAQAVADGILQAAPPTAEQQAAQAALAAQQRISGAATNGLNAPDLDLQQRQALNDAYKAGGMDGLAAAMEAAGIPRAVN
jgi:hypothetical protein